MAQRVAGGFCPHSQEYKEPPQVCLEQKHAGDLPKCTETWSDDHLPIDIVLLTVESCDFLSCFSLLDKPFKSYKKEIGYVYFGGIGDTSDQEKLKIALVRCHKGAATPGGSLTAILNTVRVLRPKAAFSVGTCISLGLQNAKMGDVVISCKLTAEGFRTPVSPLLSCLIQDAPYGWVAPLQNPDEMEVKVHCDGDILSLSQRENCRCDDIFERYPGAVAIETEGEGLYAAAYDANIEWVIVKGVASYFHQSQCATSEWMSFASTMAASMVAKMLKDPTVFREWPHYNQGTVTSFHREREDEQDTLQDLSKLRHKFPHFVNRNTDELSYIVKCLDPENKQCQGVFIDGATGIGKTTLATEAANKLRNDNRNVVVAYIDCKDIKSFESFAGTVIEQICRSPSVDDPAAEIKKRLIGSKDYVLFLDNFECFLEENNNQQEEQPSTAAPSRDCRERVQSLIGEIANCPTNIKFLVTSSERVPFLPMLAMKAIHLKPFDKDESFKLLEKVRCGDEISVKLSEELCKICSGIPLVLHTLISSQEDLTGLLDYLERAPPEKRANFLQKMKAVPQDKKIEVCLNLCFQRLTRQVQLTLLSLCLYKGLFTPEKAAEIFCSPESIVLELQRCNLLHLQKFPNKSKYTFLTVIRDHFKLKAKQEYREEIQHARGLLIDYLISFLKKTFKVFLGKNSVKSAIEEFSAEKENVMQLVEWIDQGQMDEERIKKCIDVFNVAGEMLSKMIAKFNYRYVYKSLAKKCREMGGQRRLAECLTSLGIQEIFNCICATGLSDEAIERARPSLEKAHMIQTHLQVNRGNSRAQCLAKLGRCLVKSSDTERGHAMIEEAIRIRKAAVQTPDDHEEEGGENVCYVMLGATYNDKAVALSFENRHREAVNIRESQVMEIYRERLGAHPFTATILNNMSNNHRDLGEFEAAEEYAEQALRIRLELLADDRDTTKSLFDLGIALKGNKKFREARDILEQCKTMQGKVVNDNTFEEKAEEELRDVNRLLETEKSEGQGQGRSKLRDKFPHFVNRKTDELSHIVKCLDPKNRQCQGVFIDGAPGIGKTVLATEAANKLRDDNVDVVIAYIDCKDIRSYDSFAETVMEQICRSPSVDDPGAEIKKRLIIGSNCYFYILFLDNFECFLEDNNKQQEDQPLTAAAPSRDCRERVDSFIDEITEYPTNVKFLVTSSEKVPFLRLAMETIHLNPFDKEESSKLLEKVRCGDKISVERSEELCKICSGIPLLLHTLISSQEDLIGLLKYLEKAPPGERTNFLQKMKAVPKDKNIESCLNLCFQRLTPQAQLTLLHLCLYKGLFTPDKAAKIFCSPKISQDNLIAIVLELGRCNLLHLQKFQETNKYTFLTVIREHFKLKAKEEYREEIQHARGLLIDYLISFLKETFKVFLGKNSVKEAIEELSAEKENVMQLVEWIDNGEMDEERVKKCIDVFNVAGEMLAKMMANSNYRTVYESLAKKSREMGDQQRLAECLASLGIKEIFNCICATGLCNKAIERARPRLEEAHRIQTHLQVNKGNSRAQCLAKLGRCLVRSSDTARGKAMIEEAIRIRDAAVHTPDDHEEEGGKNVCHVMLGATYNDKAVAHSFENDHREAVNIRERQVMPIYRERLGDHPFTATILNNLSNNHRDLGEFQAAEEYAEQALDIRRKLLAGHRDTTKSLFDLGVALKANRKFREARDILEQCKTMQEKVVNDNNVGEKVEDELRDVNRLLETEKSEGQGQALSKLFDRFLGVTQNIHELSDIANRPML